MTEMELAKIRDMALARAIEALTLQESVSAPEPGLVLHHARAYYDFLMQPAWMTGGYAPSQGEMLGQAADIGQCASNLESGALGGSNVGGSARGVNNGGGDPRTGIRIVEDPGDRSEPKPRRT